MTTLDVESAIYLNRCCRIKYTGRRVSYFYQDITFYLLPFQTSFFNSNSITFQTQTDIFYTNVGVTFREIYVAFYRHWVNLCKSPANHWNRLLFSTECHGASVFKLFIFLIEHLKIAYRKLQIYVQIYVGHLFCNCLISVHRYAPQHFQLSKRRFISSR